MTISETLRQTMEQLADAGVDTPRLDAQLLLAWALDCRREDLAREPERLLSPGDVDRFHQAVQRRAGRVPLPYITGSQDFFGRAFRVSEAVLIPRPETEMLISGSLQRLTGLTAPKIVDVGTGSGCIAVTLACEWKDASIWATDISEDALNVARANASIHDVTHQVTFLEGDLLRPVLDGGTGRFDLVVSNPPYVAVDDIQDLQPEVRDHEPRFALSGRSEATGPDGTGLYGRLFAEGYQALVSGGWLMVEIGFGQAQLLEAAARSAGFVDVVTTADLAGIPRVLEGRKT